MAVEALYVLPEPDGPEAVGTRVVEGAVVRYPAIEGGEPALLLPRVEAAALTGPLGVDEDALAMVEGHAVEGAEPTDGPHPVVLLSAGPGLPRVLYAGLAEALASHGYVVAIAEHADAPPGAVPDTSEDGDDELARGRADDLLAVLDAVEGDGLGVGADPERVAVVGHSYGGAVAAALVATDERVDVGANLDGSVPGPGAAGVDRPFLTLTSDGHDVDADPTLAPFAGDLHVLEGTGHLSFSDLPWLRVTARPRPVARHRHPLGSRDPRRRGRASGRAPGRHPRMSQGAGRASRASVSMMAVADRRSIVRRRVRPRSFRLSQLWNDETP